MFDHILLEPVQKELFTTIVEAARNIQLEKRVKFLVFQTHEGIFLRHPGVPTDKEKIYYGDIEILANEGLLNLDYGSSDVTSFDVTPLGFQYYKYLKKQIEEPIEQLEYTVRSYIESHEFKNKYPVAFYKWSSAEDLLWETDNDQQLTTIGHLCREAVQEFADVLVNEFKIQNEHTDKTKTIARIKAILKIKSSELGSTEKPFLDAILSYWVTVNDLIQRQVHGLQKDNKDLIWEDGRRVVFQTMIIMYEIDKVVYR